MVLRSFFAIDSENLVVTSSPSTGIEGTPIRNNSDTPDGTIFQYSAGGGTTITVDDTSGNPDVFEDDQAFGHSITDGGGIVANGTPVESESFIDIRQLDESDQPTGPVIRLYVFSQNFTTSDVWGFAASERLIDGASYVKVSGSNAGSSLYSDYVACFADGTLIETADGLVPVQQIHVGQKVWTRDNGLQPVLWVGSTSVPATGRFAPVVFAPNALGNSRELVVSQQHRMMIDTSVAELLFGVPRALVAAKFLCGMEGVSIREGGHISYWHIMFDQHQIVRSEGVLSESFFVSPTSIGALDRPQRAEILSLFPELRGNSDAYGPTAAPILKPHEAAVLRSHLSRLNTAETRVAAQ
ncbi:Hint domain-containing protein [Ruegeria sp. R13_0]|uniref:Hint domain-containing protein n=1 Tax=Ruegeria sp. R13_0 TaxID=2821099 RepID=UPI001ADBF37E|nr:Hint domain-containing protein [Ruegeria sp. R13_0]MBO9434318.1 Hint domain-containing protein [Ruegeria sp. R13_0]